MPLGPGYTDPNGVYLYGEDDTRALPSDLLNLAPASISHQLALIRADITQVMQLQAWYDEEVWEYVWALDPWGSRLPMRYRSNGARVFIEGYGTLQTAGTTVFTLPTDFRPKDQMRTVNMIGAGGQTILILANGQINFETAQPVGTTVGIKFDFPRTW